MTIILIVIAFAMFFVRTTYSNLSKPETSCLAHPPEL